MEYEVPEFIHRSPSVGSVIKKVVAINPDLTTSEIIAMVRQSIEPLGDSAGEFSVAEVVNEGKVLELARKSLTLRRR